MTQATVSQAYLLGISEGRAALRYLQARGEYEGLPDARAMLATSERLLGQGFAGEMRDCLKGERDFWRNQISKMERESRCKRRKTSPSPPRTAPTAIA